MHCHVVESCEHGGLPDPDHEFYLHGDLVWMKLGMDLAHHCARMLLHPTLARPRCHQHRCLAELDDEHEGGDGWRP